MTERTQYTEDQLEEIAEAVWGSGLLSEETTVYHVACPLCGADIRVYVDSTHRRRPPRFRAICSGCGIDSSGDATSVEMRQITEEEMEEILELSLRGRRAICPACQAPLSVEELPIAGRGTRHFMVKCRRCGTRGQRRWSSGRGGQP